MAETGKGDSKGRGTKSRQGANMEAATGDDGGFSASEPLTDREEWVCREYVAGAGANKTRAYMKVFKGCTYDSARTLAAKFFADVRILARVKDLTEERNRRLEVSADKVIAGIAALAYFDPRDIFDENGKVRPFTELDPDLAGAITGIETIHKVTGDERDEVAVITKIKLADRGQNLERLGKHLKLFTDKTELSGPEGKNLTLEVVFGKD